MARKTPDPSGDTGATAQGSRIRDSAQQIWLAGLGAFAKAQAEGGKVFDALVKEGVELQRQSQTTAQDRIQEATSRMASMANEFSARASGEWDKLGSLFEDRVARALQRLGVPLAADLQALQARVDELERERAEARATHTAGAKARRPSPAARSPKAAGAPRTAPRKRAPKG